MSVIGERRLNDMIAIRVHGSAPYETAVIHGGPGVPGEMEAVAGVLSADRGVLEPLQRENSLEGQVEGLYTLLLAHGDAPITLIGHSWGAWLAVILAYRYRSVIERLVLVASGPFEERYATGIMETRLARLTRKERYEFEGIVEALNDPHLTDKDLLFEQAGRLLFKTDSYDPMSKDSRALEYQYGVFKDVWPEASELRSSGRLLEMAAELKCPVLALHGDYDPHPWAGVSKPLSGAVEDFRFVLLENCGHYPWLEREARDPFFEVINRVLPSAAQ